MSENSVTYLVSILNLSKPSLCMWRQRAVLPLLKRNGTALLAGTPYSSVLYPTLVGYRTA